MQCPRLGVTASITGAVLGAALLVTFLVPDRLTVTESAASAAPSEMILIGGIRDFHRGDAKLAGSGPSGHFAGNIQRWLPGDKRPRFIGGGFRVDAPWTDSSGRSIAPHIAGVRGGVAAERLGVRVHGRINIDEATVDAYNSNYGPYGVGGNYGAHARLSTNSTAHESVEVDDAIVRGDIIVGPGGSPSSVVDNDGTITGVIAAADEAFEMPSLVAPDDPDDLEAHQPVLLQEAGTFTLVGDTTPDDEIETKALWYTDVTFKQATIRIEGDLRIRCDGLLTIDESTIELAPESALTIYITSNQTVQIRRSSINTDVGDSTLVAFNYLGTAGVRCSSDSHVCATVVAPQGRLEIDRSHVYGGFIGNELSVDGDDDDGVRGGFHVDLSNATLGERNFALTVREKIEIEDDSVIDSFDSTIGPYGVANSGFNALVTSNSIKKPEKVKVKDSRLGGDLMIGPDGDIDKVVKVEGSGIITGAIGRQSEPVAIPVVAPPAMGASVGHRKYESQHVTLDTDLHCKKLELDKSSITIRGDVVIRSDDKIELKDGSEIRLEPGATLTIYVKKEIKLDDDCRLNMNGAVCGDPKAVSIRRTSVGKKGKISIKKNSMLSAWIQGAKTELKVEEGSHFFGSFIGRKVKVKKDSYVHVDMAYFNDCVDVADVAGTAGIEGTGRISSSTAFDEWFRDVPGANSSTTQAITLRLNGGAYEYLNNSFYPVDRRLFGNEGEGHNYHFTYAISGSFTYSECAGQFFDFEGGDGAWLFIDGRLVMDLGGFGVQRRQFVDLDRFGLTDGGEYDINFFYAQRQAVSSVFRMRTNLEIATTDNVTVSSMFD